MNAGFLFAALMLALQFPQPVQPSGSTIEGIVLNAVTGEPLAQAQIAVVRTNNGPRDGAQTGQRGADPGARGGAPNIGTSSALTDADGKFMVRDVAPGAYRLFAVRNGYTAQEYGQRAPGRPGTVLQVEANQFLKNIDFRLTPAGTVTGRVTDGNGAPLPRIAVQLLRSSYDATGKRQLSSVTSDTTDDRGEYRLFWVPPGRYFLSASPSQSILDQLASVQALLGGNGEANEQVMDLALSGFTSNQAVASPGYALTYYPSTSDVQRAASLDVRPGNELAAVDIRMDRQRGAARIRGSVLDVRTGQPPRTVTLLLVPSSTSSAAQAAGSMKTVPYNPATGTFEVANVAPGSYILLGIGGNMLGFLAAMTNAEQSGGPIPADLPTPDIAQLSLEVTGDMDGVVLKILPAMPINGQATVSGFASVGNLEGFARIRVYLAPEGDEGITGGMLAPASINADGKFVIKAAPGTYRIQFTGLPANAYVKAARLGARDILNGTVTLEDTTSDTLFLEIGANPGAIRGLILDKSLQPVRSLQAVLIPENRGRRDLYKTAMSSEDGRFQFTGITPGTYKLFAWEDLEANAYYDPEVLRTYEAQGKTVIVQESGEAQVELRPIPLQ